MKGASRAGYRGIHLGGPPSGRGAGITGGKDACNTAGKNPGGRASVQGRNSHNANIGTREPHAATNTGPKGSN